MKCKTNRVQFWPKDGLWHALVSYQPTDAARKQFPVSYPPGDKGPFFTWQGGGFETYAQAADFRLATEVAKLPDHPSWRTTP